VIHVRRRRRTRTASFQPVGQINGALVICLSSPKRHFNLGTYSARNAGHSIVLLSVPSVAAPRVKEQFLSL
jgi:hypothetical protein